MARMRNLLLLSLAVLSVLPPGVAAEGQGMEHLIINDIKTEGVKRPEYPEDMPKVRSIAEVDALAGLNKETGKVSNRIGMAQGQWSHLRQLVSKNINYPNEGNEAAIDKYVFKFYEKLPKSQRFVFDQRLARPCPSHSLTFQNTCWPLFRAAPA